MPSFRSIKSKIKFKPLVRLPATPFFARRVTASSLPSIEGIERFEPFDGDSGARFLARGAAADIWIVEVPAGSSSEGQVVHKVLRVDPMCSELAVFGTEYHKELWRGFVRDYRAKVEQWGSLEYENVVRVLGLGAGLNLRVEMCELGSVREFIKTKPQLYPTKIDIMVHVLEGLQYLHTHDPPIVHGNLNAGKLFINAGGTTKIGEFGLAALCDPFSSFVSAVSVSGLVRWMSPELLDTDLGSMVDPTTESDIWSLGCVFLEIIAETIPYSNCTHDVPIRRKIIAGELPGKRDKHFESRPFDSIWPLLERCWQSPPGDRPSVSGLFEQARPILQGSGGQIKPQLSAPYIPPAGPSTAPGNEDSGGPLPVSPADPKLETSSAPSLPQEADISDWVPGQSLPPNQSVTVLIAIDAEDGETQSHKTDQDSFTQTGLARVTAQSSTSDHPPAAPVDLEQISGHSTPSVSPTVPPHYVPRVSLPTPGASPDSSPMPHAPIPKPRPSARHVSASPKARSSEVNTARLGLEAFRSSTPDLLPPLKPVLSDAVAFLDVYKDALAADKDDAALWMDLQSLVMALNTSFTSDNPILVNLCSSIDNELDKVSSRVMGGRLWVADLAKARVCRDQIRGHVDTATLRVARSHGTILGEPMKRLDELAKSTDTRKLEEYVKLMEESAKEKAIEELLKELKPSFSAFYRSSEAANLRRECTPYTRKGVLSHLDKWRRGPIQGNIFWMNGMAGTGKTTIANTLCATLKSEQKLGGSFFCTRMLPECRSAKLILPTIAYQLAHFSSAFRNALFQVLKSDPDLRFGDLPTQLEGLILSPLLNATERLSSDVVIVIDALDECEDRTAVEEILGVLADHAWALPIKVLVSSRPEGEIRRKIGGTQSKIVLHELDKRTVMEDIGVYLRKELYDTLISHDQLTKLVERAGTLFIYASTVVRFIKSKRSPSGQQERLKIVLSTSTHEHKIDELYSAVLQSAFSNPELLQPDRTRMRDIIHTVVCAQEPLTVDTLARLLQLANSELVFDALEPLWSVVHVSGTGGTSLITTLHPSFPDYIFDENRSTIYSCNATARHGRLAELCLERIESNEREFNICELESSYVPDEQVPGLEDRINNVIPLDLLYACQYWATHLEFGEWSTDRVKLLEHFLSKRLLMWMEVLNLKKRMNTGVVLLEKARKWCTNGGGSEAIGELIHDAWRFATTFASNPISRSTPHIYVSMLAFRPSSKLITDCYVKQARRLAEVTGSGMTRRQLALLGVFAVGSWVWSMAISPDGTRIICGCDDGTISVWDAQSGKQVLGPLKGHTGRVSSVAFSPDGLRIASGSYDKTVLVWDARSGKMASEPLEGHTGRVESVAFSPDSARIVSCSDDETIRVWDVQIGQMVLGPLKGHTSSILSAAFSPDGTRIVSGSGDNTICVWDSRSGQVALGPLEGHTDRVNSVAFSPDGDQIVSGSGDRTLRVWDARNGKPILEPLKGHTDSVNAVAFSPNGTHIVSGSDDKSIRAWDTRSGKLVLGPLEGHTNRVTSVAFSPNGMGIVSGSDDQTIHVWDAQSREVASEPLEGHTEMVRPVAFAPDGTRIVSGSEDRTIQVWDAQTGNLVLGPLEGHTSSVSAVAFSPDGRLIVSGSADCTIRVWDAQNGVVVPRSPMRHTSSVNSVSFSSEGARIVSGSDRTIHVWDVQSGEQLLGPLEGHRRSVTSVVFSPNGMQIASGSEDQTLMLWDAHNGKMVLDPLQGHTSFVYSVAFSPNGRSIVSGSDDMTLRMWDAQSGNMVLGPLEGHTASVRSVAFSPNGTYIASGSDDKTIRVWAAQTGELVLGPLNGHTWSIRSVSFSPDSTHIVSGSDDKVVRVWHLPSRLPPANPGSPPPASPSPSRAVADSPISQPNLSHQPTHNMPLQWLLNEEGWVMDERQHLWLWVPPDLRASLILPHNYNTLLISTQGSVQLKLDGVAIGESWADCHTPA